MDFADFDANDPYAHAFVTSMTEEMAKYRSLLTEHNFSNLVSLLMSYVINIVERGVLQQQFNSLGGLQFDKDMRVIIAFFSRMYGSSVRDRFKRISAVRCWNRKNANFDLMRV